MRRPRAARKWAKHSARTDPARGLRQPLRDRAAGAVQSRDHAGAAAGSWLWLQFFGDRHGFLRSLRLALQPDIVSALRGEYDEAIWETLRMLAFAASCAAGTTLVYKALKLLA